MKREFIVEKVAQQLALAYRTQNPETADIAAAVMTPLSDAEREAASRRAAELVGQQGKIVLSQREEE